MYIVIEGQDATGKDTQAKLLADYLREKGQNVVHYSESGTGSKDSFVQEIAKLNYGSNQDIDHRTRVLLYLVNRYEQWRKLAEPVLKSGGTVITTRNWYSTLIYEGYGAGVSRSLITKLHKAMMPERYFKPDKIVIMTVSPEKQAERLGVQVDSAGKNRQNEFWKSKGGEFQQKLNRGYLKIAQENDVPELSADGSIEEVFASLLKLFQL